MYLVNKAEITEIIRQAGLIQDRAQNAAHMNERGQNPERRRHALKQVLSDDSSDCEQETEQNAEARRTEDSLVETKAKKLIPEELVKYTLEGTKTLTLK